MSIEPTDAEPVGKSAIFDLNGAYGFASYLIRIRLDVRELNDFLERAGSNATTPTTDGDLKLTT